MNIPKEFLIERQGKQFVLYAGLLHEAHKNGLVSIQTELVRWDERGALFKAVVTMTNEKDGARTFEGHGDANEANVGRNIAAHYVRMAETRAKARALRDALDIGAAAVEELGDADDEPEPRRQPERRPPPIDMDDQQQQPNHAPTPIHRPAQQAGQHQGQDLATPPQVRAIYLIGRELGMTEDDIDRRSVGSYRKPPAELTKREASDLITKLKTQQGQAG